MRSEDMEYKRLLVWAKAKRALSQAEDDEQWASVIEMIMRYPDLVERYELIHKLRHLEKFNNSDVPGWVWGVIADGER